MRPGRQRLAGTLLLLTLGSGCASGPSPEGPSPGRSASPVTARPLDGPGLDERALLLLLEDRRVFDAVAIRPLLAGPRGTREALAVSLGRIGDPEARLMLESLLVDPEATVRRAAAFALGEVGSVDPSGSLRRAAADADRETGRLAVEALAKSATPLSQVRAALAGLPPQEAAHRVLPALFRFRQTEDDALVLETARETLLVAAGVDEAGGGLRRAAAYGLARDARPAFHPALRGLLDDSDPWIRGWGARGLGAVGEGADLALLRPLLEDREPGPVIQSLRAGQRLIEAGKAGPPADWRPILLRLLGDPRPGITVTAAEAAGAWLLDGDLGEALARLAAGTGRPAEVAMLALAGGGDPRGLDFADRWSSSSDRVRRLRAAEATGSLGPAGEAIRARLAVDPWPAVRAAVLQVQLDPAAGLGLDADLRREIARRALADADPVVRASVLDLPLASTGLGLADVEASLALGRGDREPDARLAAIRALVGLARPEAGGEPGPVVDPLAALAALASDDAEFLVRRAAGQALRGLGRPAPSPGAAETEKPLSSYLEVVERTGRPREVDVRTAHGVFRLLLDCPQAPRTCLSFLQLATQGFFDGLAFHRVVPDFVAQGGDPRGDGSGGPGYVLRDEINRLRYERGAVGMALSGPDTGGSQFFVTLSPQPHLDGGYTVFGRVIDGMDVVDRIQQGDRMERVVVRP